MPELKKDYSVNRKQVDHLIRKVRLKGWTDEAFRRYLRFRGIFRALDMKKWDYTQALLDLENEEIKAIMHDMGTPMSDGRKMERRHLLDEEDRDVFYAGYAMIELSDDEVFTEMGAHWSDPDRARTAFLEIRTRLQAYRLIARTLEHQA